jgi:hypothetical protein
MPGYDHRQRKTSFPSRSPGHPSNQSHSNNQTGTNSQTGTNTQRSIQDRKSAYESMQDAGMLSPSISGISLYDKSPVIYDKNTTSQQILGANDPTDIGGQQVDLSNVVVDGLTPFYSTYSPDAINTGNVSYKARMYALNQGATEEEAQAVADQASAEVNKLVSNARSTGDYSEVDNFFAGENEFFQSILPKTLYENTGAGGFTGSPTGYVGQDPVTKRFFDIKDPTSNILNNRRFPSSGGSNYRGYGGGSGGGYGGYRGFPLPGIMYGNMEGENQYAPLNMNEFMVNVHSPMYANRGGIMNLLGDY